MAESAQTKPQRSRLVPWGLALIAISLICPLPLSRLSDGSFDYAARLGYAILSDLARACFFVGIGILLIGILRNRRWRGIPPNGAV